MYKQLGSVVLLSFGLVLSACGGGGTATAPTAATSVATTAATAAAPTATEAATSAPATAAATAATVAPTVATAAATVAPAAATAAATAATVAATTATTATTATATTAATAAAATAATAAQAERFVIVPEESEVTYRVGETFINRNNQYVVAVGTTRGISGEITLDRANPQNSRLGEITIDISQFASDSERRDNAIRDRWLESARFPIATFTVTKIDGLPANYADGQEVTLQISGDLKVRDAVRPTTFETVGKIEGDTMSGRATTQVKMTDFGFDPPSILNILNAEDDVQIEFAFVARKQ